MSDPKRASSKGGTSPATALPHQLSSIRRALVVPEVLDDRYRIVDRIGAGAVGVVLRAEDLFLERPAAIKVIEPSGDEDADAVAFERFVKEAQAIAQVRHENVVQVYAFGLLPSGPPYLAMELVAGRSLEAVIDDLVQRGTTMPLPRALAILQAIGAGLEAVHARKLVHRDVKPANVILEDGTDRPVLIDFGLARGGSTSNPAMTISAGTPAYMAPEQARDPRRAELTNRTDIYAFACTAFELLTGRPLFEGDDIYTQLVAHVKDPPRRISSVRPELAPLDEALLRALAKDPRDRHATIGELVLALTAGAEEVDGERQRRILVLAAQPSLGRSLARSTTAAVRARGVGVRCEVATTAAEAASVLAVGSFDLLVLDEESAAGRLGELVNLAHSVRATTQVVVVSRDFRTTQRTITSRPLRHLVPKPVNAHVLAAVLGRVELGPVSPGPAGA